MNRTKLRILIGVGALAVLAILVLLLLGESSDPKRAPDGLLKDAHDLVGTSSAEFEARLRNGFDVSAEQLLEDYRKLLRYPPNSRPLRPSDVDLINFHQIKMPEEPLPVQKDGKAQPTEHTCVFQPGRHVVFEGARLEATLFCNDSGRKGHVPLEPKDFILERLQDDAAGKTQRIRLPAPALERNKDNRYVFTYKPRREDWGNVMLRASFTIPGARVTMVHEKSAVFFVSPETPARFTGIVDESVVDGSLQITVALTVLREGRYEIEANLFGSDGEPLTYAREQVRFKAGPQTMKLTFFGKIFHEKAAVGPYFLRGLRGHQDTGLDPDILLLPPDEVRRRLAERLGPGVPDKRIIPPYEGEFKTVAYRLADFSDKEHDSPEKRDRLRQLEALARKE